MSANATSDPCGAVGDDVVVVGAGPAGATLALLLLRDGRRVTLVEKSSGGDERAFRGEILQPSGQQILADLGVLDAARACGHREHSRFQLVDGERVHLDIDYRRLPAPYDCLLSVPQPHVLAALLDECARHPGFTHLPGSRVRALTRAEDTGAVTGVVAVRDGAEMTVPASVVVAADGRYSKTRTLAGIEFDRSDDFDYDLLWFRLTGAEPDPDPVVRVYRDGAGPVLLYRSHPDVLQVGWILPHGGYRAVVADGFDAVREGLARALPEHADLIRAQVRGPADVSLLDVFAGSARRWCHDGLLLVGDAAHVHSPIGAQGINLAMQDAVLAARVLGEALDRGDVSAAVLDRFRTERAPAVARIHRIQRLQSKGMLSRNPIADRIRPRVARLLAHTPVAGKILAALAYGDRSLTVPAPRVPSARV